MTPVAAPAKTPMTNALVGSCLIPKLNVMCGASRRDAACSSLFLLLSANRAFCSSPSDCRDGRLGRHGLHSHDHRDDETNHESKS
mmetsp:Transcript_33462/g.72418  ORF Transcript_33462/g.72418 Transcript_33462/m.72418 type:complete len:85 (-) Transcript_33462:1991-2245(-)